MKKLTKKEFKEMCSYHKYGRYTKALFFDWKEGEGFRGYKYCLRSNDTTKKELEDQLYKLVTEDEEPDWWLSPTIALVDTLRFKVPVSSGGLTNLTRHPKWLTNLFSAGHSTVFLYQLGLGIKDRSQNESQKRKAIAYVNSILDAYNIEKRTVQKIAIYEEPKGSYLVPVGSTPFVGLSLLKK